MFHRGAGESQLRLQSPQVRSQPPRSGRQRRGRPPDHGAREGQLNIGGRRNAIPATQPFAGAKETAKVGDCSWRKLDRGGSVGKLVRGDGQQCCTARNVARSCKCAVYCAFEIRRRHEISDPLRYQHHGRGWRRAVARTVLPAHPVGALDPRHRGVHHCSVRQKSGEENRLWCRLFRFSGVLAQCPVFFDGFSPDSG